MTCPVCHNQGYNSKRPVREVNPCFADQASYRALTYVRMIAAKRIIRCSFVLLDAVDEGVKVIGTEAVMTVTALAKCCYGVAIVA